MDGPNANASSEAEQLAFTALLRLVDRDSEHTAQEVMPLLTGYVERLRRHELQELLSVEHAISFDASWDD